MTRSVPLSAPVPPTWGLRLGLLLAAAVVVGCNPQDDKELAPCEQWQASVATCAEQASVVLDTGAVGVEVGTGADASAAKCSDDPSQDPEWLKDLYDCYVTAYQGIDCGVPEQAVDLGILLADCGVIHGG